MGCSSSTPAASPASTVTIGGKAGKVTMTRAELLEWEKKRHERELEKQLQRRLYEQKDLLREKALPMMLDSTSCDDLTALVEDGDTVAQLQQLRRKEAKQKAEAEQRWMVIIRFRFIFVECTNTSLF